MDDLIFDRMTQEEAAVAEKIYDIARSHVDAESRKAGQPPRDFSKQYIVASKKRSGEGYDFVWIDKTFGGS